LRAWAGRANLDLHCNQPWDKSSAGSNGLDTTLGRGRGQLSTPAIAAAIARLYGRTTPRFGRTSQHVSAVSMRRGREACGRVATCPTRGRGPRRSEGRHPPRWSQAVGEGIPKPDAYTRLNPHSSPHLLCVTVSSRLGWMLRRWQRAAHMYEYAAAVLER
jgi:hypothetical protein